MLRRRSIRTKLLAGLVTLTGVICCLAYSGISGLNRYDRLARVVAETSKELRLANDLHRLAVTLDEKNDRLMQPEAEFGMIEPISFDEGNLFAGNWRDVYIKEYDAAWEQLERSLESYSVLLDSRDPNLRSSLIYDSSHNVDEIVTCVDSIRLTNQHATDPRQYRKTLDKHYDNLIVATETNAVEMSESMVGFTSQVRSSYRTWIAIAWFLLLGAIATVLVMIWLFWTYIVQPFRTLLEGSRMVANHAAFGHRISLGTNDELDELASAMNAMSSKFSMVYNHSEQLRQNLETEVRDRTREVIRNEQLASVGFLAAGVAHEINNPLTTIAWGAESLEAQVADLDHSDEPTIHGETAEFLRSTLKQIQSEAFRCKGITDRLLDFSRMSEVRRESTDLSKLVDDVVELVSKVGQYHYKTIRTHHSGPTIAEVNSHQIRQVVLNLITNALESVDSDGAVDVSVFTENQNAKIVVEDNGCGMSDEVMTHLFEPFFTRRQNGKGTGLGLSITYRIVSQHGGSLTPHSEGEGQGSRLEVTLPLTTENENETEPTVLSPAVNMAA
ncbi:sensor histidine kinase [Crateriforma spongiae]|uniref:sensor histidine kinase n=1 Tax=Crateriforma spongiae TaxID=2724528 RepID=UPI0039AF20F6